MNDVMVVVVAVWLLTGVDWQQSGVNLAQAGAGVVG